nr:protein ALP1-like isoform X1 [Tanacetum cinerariifolium]
MRIIKAIHEGDGKIGRKAKLSFPSIWLDIVHEVELFKDRGTDLVYLIHKKLGNRANTLFWEEPWRGGTAFKNLYLILYALELSKNRDVASKMTHCNLGYSFRREPRGGVEQALFDSMLEKVEASKTCWIKVIPIKVNVHAWKVKLDCLPTRINISWRALIVCIGNGLIVRKHGTANLGVVIKKYQTIMLEAVASYDIWIWHAFFGVAGANNDLTVLNHSLLFDDLLDDIARIVSYEVNGVTFEKGYYLVDGVYPQWATFVKSFTVVRDEKMSYLNIDKKVLEKTLKELLVSSKAVMTLSGFGKDNILRTLVGRPIAVAAMASLFSMPPILLLPLSMPCDDCNGCVMIGGASRTAFRQMQPVNAAMAVSYSRGRRQHEGLYQLGLGQHLVVYFKGMCILDSRFIDVAAEIVIVYAWTHDLWFRVAYAFVLFSFDATVAFVAAIHDERHASGSSTQLIILHNDQCFIILHNVEDGGIDHPHNLTRHPIISEHDTQSKGAHHERIVQAKEADLHCHSRCHTQNRNMKLRIARGKTNINKKIFTTPSYIRSKEEKSKLDNYM